MIVDLAPSAVFRPSIQPQDKHLVTAKPLVTLELLDGKPRSLNVDFPELEKLPLEFLAIILEGVARFVRRKVSPEVQT